MWTIDIEDGHTSLKGFHCGLFYSLVLTIHWAVAHVQDGRKLINWGIFLQACASMRPGLCTEVVNPAYMGFRRSSWIPCACVPV